MHIQQCARIGHADFGQGRGAGAQILLYQRFCARHFRVHQLKGQQRGCFSLRADGLPAFCGKHCTRQVAGCKTHTADCSPCGGAFRGAGLEFCRQRLLKQFCRQFFVGHARKIARQIGDCQRALCRGGQLHIGLERVHGFSQAVQCHQNLQHIAVGFPRGGLGLAPGPRSLQRRVSGT